MFFIHFPMCHFGINRFFIRNLRRPLVTLNLELTFQAIKNDLQMQLTHSTDHSLSSILVRFHTECRILFRQFGDSHTHFIHISLCFRLHRHSDNRFRKCHCFQYNWVLFITQCITCFNIFKSDSSSNVTCFKKLNWILFVCMHLEDTRNTFFISTACVQYIRACIQAPGICTKETQATNERIRSNFKCQSCKWFFNVWFAENFFSSIRVNTFYAFFIHRTWH